MKRITVVEGFILLAIIMIIGSLFFTVGSNKDSYSFGVNGLTETRCQNGYLVIVGGSGSVQQVLNENGGGIKCN